MVPWGNEETLDAARLADFAHGAWVLHTFSAGDLASRLSTSIQTVRRRLDRLEELGLVRKRLSSDELQGRTVVFEVVEEEFSVFVRAFCRLFLSEADEPSRDR